MDPTLDNLRARLDAIDARLIAAAAERQRVVEQIGEWKATAGRQLRDFARERQVLDRAADTATREGLEPQLAQQLLRTLIEASLATQERQHVRLRASGAGRRAVVIGGGGRMGRWVARFLDAASFAVQVSDPAGSPDGLPVVDWHDAAVDADLIVVAAPLRISGAVLHELAAITPRGVVFDIGSLKAPLVSGLEALREAGARVTSVHPMFGPSANTLAGRHVILADVGVPEATAVARELFATTPATLVEMSLGGHDRLIGWVLGLSHAVNIAFAGALAGSGEMAARLAAASSTTFDRQLAIARDVVAENPQLYFEIQHLNREHGAAALAAFGSALQQLTAAVRDGDEAAFVQLMDAGRGYLHGATGATGATGE
ncbi:MAG: prephenate dehydrogenase/arogenate dehydrogenase family protein [Planctomycetota bacterium]